MANWAKLEKVTQEESKRSWTDPKIRCISSGWNDMKEKGKKVKTSSSSRQNPPNSSTTILPISNNNKQEGKQDEDSKLCLQAKSSSTATPKEELVEEDEVNNDVSRLEELCLLTEEPELSVEQLTINNQLQEDKLLAMEAIYGDNLTICRSKAGQKSFQICIHIETLDELTISAKLHSFNANIKSGGKLTSLIAPAQPVNEFLYAFKVQHLPPIVLTCLLPKSYPSHQPPYFTIFVQWLNSERSSNLCHMLDSFWTDKPGQEVIYQWVDWLHSSSLSHLGFDKEIALGPYNMPDAGDRRAFSGSVSPGVDMPSMLKYNDDKCVEVFCENLHECCICLSEHAGTEFIRLPCKHFFCWKCMETYSRIHVKEGTVYKLVCPNVECDGMVPPGLLKRLLARDDFERWESLLLQKTLDSMSDVVYCPRCETACLEDGDSHAQCLKCFFSFCILCSEQRHVGTTCMGPEKRLQTLMELKELRDLKEEQSYEIQELNNEILSLKIIFCDAKQCPSCNIAISRIEGCNRMQCRNCGQAFCWGCNKALSGNSHPFCESRQRNKKLVVKKHCCPFCGEKNLKIQVDDNNHMVCLACQKHYCYLCRESFEESSQHYTLKDCRQQHTAE